MKQCQDRYSAQFKELPEMQSYHQGLRTRSRWQRTAVKSLRVVPLSRTSPLFSDHTGFDPAVSDDAIVDTADNLGLALQVDGQFYPMRDTAYKSLLDRAKINGTALPKLSRERLAEVLNACLALHKDGALVLIRDEKVSAAHSGDAKDYSILEIDQLLAALKEKIEERFPGNVFTGGYSDHSMTSASWSLPDQKEELLGTYQKLLTAQGHGAVANKLTPGIRFNTSDTGMASAKVSATLLGLQYPIHIGGIVAVEHKHQIKVSDFSDRLDMLFAQFGDSVSRLSKLLTIHMDYPVNAMTAVCKALKLPKKASMEAIAMFEIAIGDNPATAHDVFMAIQEVPFILKTTGASESKLLMLQESMARMLTLRWSDYDLAKQVSW